MEIYSPTKSMQQEPKLVAAISKRGWEAATAGLISINQVDSNTYATVVAIRICYFLTITLRLTKIKNNFNTNAKIF